MFSVGVHLIRSFVTAEPKGAYGITDEDCPVLMCALLFVTSTPHVSVRAGGTSPRFNEWGQQSQQHG